MLVKETVVAALGVAVAISVIPPPPAGVVHAGTPPETLSTWLAVPIPNRATVAEPEAYRMSPAVVTVFFGIAVPAKS